MSMHTQYLSMPSHLQMAQFRKVINLNPNVVEATNHKNLLNTLKTALYNTISTLLKK